ncbi:MAG: hypothetical protein KUG78_06725 [Kangiellaceae bacterium]|nr:hypothetical protein [Kangiellaceae bacterium]
MTLLKKLLLVLFSVSACPCVHGLDDDWLTVIRQIPYQYSNNFHENLSTIRSWVLFEKGFCEKPNRHILFNSRAEFLAYIDNMDSKSETQQKLNDTRRQLVVDKRSPNWIVGSDQSIGYPFGLNCNQPHAKVEESFARLLGESESDKLWGTWDGLKAGTKDKPISLVDLVELVYSHKSKQIGQAVVAEEFRHFLAQIIIESGAKKNGLSKQNAIGLLQLRPEVLLDCQIPKKYYRHRMAQVDCAVRLFQQNRRNLEKVFNPLFGHLPEDKKAVIFSMLLVQTYHSGIGRMANILTEQKLNQAASFFATNHQHYSAEDIATGIIYHNMGRQDLGMASLYYVIDVAIVANKLCEKKALMTSWICQ